MQFLRSVISGSRAMRVLPSIGPVAETHTVLAENSMFDFPDNTKSAIFGMGCFWGVERLFYNQKGIYSTQCKSLQTLIHLYVCIFSWLRWWSKEKSNIRRNMPKTSKRSTRGSGQSCIPSR